MSQDAPLLIVEDDLALQKQIKWTLDRFESVTAADRESALLQLRRHQAAVVTMDLGLPPDPDSVSEGFRLLEQILDLEPATKVIVLTGQNDQANALRAVSMGAYDFLAKPFEPDVLNLVVERASRLAELQAENRRLQALHQPDALSGLITRDAEMLRIGRLVERVAGSDATVLLLGESGTGKEVLSQGLHTASKRQGRFVAINCAAIPENLLESELFGYEKGAFTGAAKTTPGKIETANSGTLFLDEIGDLPHSLQAKLLRFLQQRTIERLGGRSEIPVDVRVVCATHKPLIQLVEEGRFRRDLYYRLASVTLEIPPLRTRADDIGLLARRFADELGKTLSPRALLRLEAHPWPGNVRELRHAIERASGLTGPFSPLLDEEAFAFLLTPEHVSRAPELEFGGSAMLSLAEMERVMLLKALRLARGNRAQAARILGVARSTLFEMLKRHRVVGPRAQALRDELLAESLSA